MKKTFNINVSGFPFTIDEDAYTLLNDYLNTIERAFSAEDDSAEIVGDIESRIAELLIECSSSGSPIISVTDVEKVIERVGKPEEMIDVEISSAVHENRNATEEVRVEVTPPPYISPSPRIRKKLYRDPQNAMLGGVCSGLAWYLNLDPTVVRLVTVLLTIISATTCGIAYIVLWLVVPEAHTPLERMQMMGEAPTMENIARTVTDTFKEDKYQGDRFVPSGFGGTLTRFFSILAKVLIIIALIIGIPLLVALVIGLIGCVFALLTLGTSAGAMLFGDMVPEWYAEAGNIPIYGVLCGIGCILVIGIPLFVMIMLGIRRKGKLFSQSIRNTLLIVWILGFVLAGISAGRIVSLSDDDSSPVNKSRYKEIVITTDESEINDTTVSDDAEGRVIEITDSFSKPGGKTVVISSDGITVEKPDKKVQIPVKGRKNKRKN